MSSRRTRANRRNAQHSTGPVTPEGKAAVAQNARQHGLAGAFTILAHENAADFQSLLDEYKKEFSPKSTHETFLVEEMAHSRWTLARARRIEAHLLDQLVGADPAADPEARIAAALNAKSPAALATIQRYAAAADRTYHRAHRVLTQGRSAVVRNKANEAQIWFQEELQGIRSNRRNDPPPPVCPPDPPLYSSPALAAAEFTGTFPDD
jgi:hypothetical protein